MNSARLLCLMNSKGGCSKTTTSVCIAGAFAAAGQKVLVVDADPLGTATQWITSAPAHRPFPAAVVGLANESGDIQRLIEPHLFRFDVVIVDCPPSIEAPAMERTDSVLAIADLCLVPVQPTPLDFWATQGAIEQISRARMGNPSLEAFLVATLAKKRSRLGRQVRQVIADAHIPMLDSMLCNRASFPEAALRGTVPGLLGPAHATAASEVSNLVNEILQRMGW